MHAVKRLTWLNMTGLAVMLLMLDRFRALGR